ncbi:MAG: polyprenol monophosphomannose synthase [Thermoplasmata archaeon]|nr:polyprenol monophosphomannose synthase [Thermoplasmata archaeon]
MDVSIILPTLNERQSLAAVAPRLDAALRPWKYEVVVVDDASTDGTREFVTDRADRNWRLLPRPGRFGLASAVVDGIAASTGPIIVVMDADGSHPPEEVPQLVGPIQTGRAEFVLASRKVPGGSDSGLHGIRRAISWAATIMARPLTPVRDPMSGFFAFRRSILPRAPLAPVGYKIGLEILVKCRPEPVVEVPFQFEERLAGRSKLGSNVIFAYLRHIGRLYLWRARHWGRSSSSS